MTKLLTPCYNHIKDHSCRVLLSQWYLGTSNHSFLGLPVGICPWIVIQLASLLKVTGQFESLCLTRYQGSWGHHGANLCPVGPRWTPCWPHEPCYQGIFTCFTKNVCYCELSLIIFAASVYFLYPYYDCYLCSLSPTITHSRPSDADMRH